MLVSSNGTSSVPVLTSAADRASSAGLPPHRLAEPNCSAKNSAHSASRAANTSSIDLLEDTTDVWLRTEFMADDYLMD